MRRNRRGGRHLELVEGYFILLTVDIKQLQEFKL